MVLWRGLVLLRRLRASGSWACHVEEVLLKVNPFGCGRSLSIDDGQGMAASAIERANARMAFCGFVCLPALNHLQGNNCFSGCVTGGCVVNKCMVGQASQVDGSDALARPCSLPHLDFLTPKYH